MYNHRNLSWGLKDNLLSIIAGNPDREQLNRTISVFHALASAFLTSKSTSGMLSSVTGLKISDIAYDCIAELFHKNNDGDYIQLVSYFAGLQLSNSNDEETLVYSRRLVFSKVNHGIYRLYSQCDPSLAKILRNIKLAVHSLNNFDEIDRFGESCLMPVLCDGLEQLPPFQEDELDQLFYPVTKGDELIPELLAKLSLVLREQSERCRIVPLICVGLLFRSVYNMKRSAQPDVIQIEDATIVNDVEEIIKNVCAEIKSQISKKYVHKKTISHDLIEKYFQVMKDGLIEKYVNNNGEYFSLFTQLKNYIPELTKEEYKNKHRNTLEYFWKLTQKETIKRIKE